jgi:hypothetical protein
MSGRGRTATAGRWALVVVVLVLLIVPGRLLAAEHDRDDALIPYADQRAGGQVLTGETWHVDAGVVSVGTAPVQVVAVRPRVTVDTAEADITVRLCLPAPGGTVDRSTAPIADECRSVSDVPTQDQVRLAPGTAQLVVSVTPRKAGRVQIEGYDVTYIDAGHRGTEHAGREVLLRAV